MNRPPVGLLLLPVVVLLLAGSVVTLLSMTGWGPGSVRARQLQHQLPTLPDEEIAGQIAQISQLGDAGIGILIQTLTTSRASVAAAARKSIRDEIARWETLPPERASRKVALTARALAESIDDIEAINYPFAAELATRFLLWPVDQSAIDNGRLIAHCESVLRQSPGRTTVSAEIAATNTRPGPEQRELADEFSESDSPLGLPARIVEIPTPPQDPGVPAVSKSSSSTPAGLQTPHQFPEQSEGLRPVSQRPSAGLVEGQSPLEHQPPAQLWHVTDDEPPVINGMDQMEYVQVMRLLHSASLQLAAEAENELIRRGLTSDEIAVAARFGHQDRTVRLALVRQLPQMTGIDPRQWLLWLASDEDAEVRQTALSILATSRDPIVQNRVREIAERAGQADMLPDVEKR